MVFGFASAKEATTPPTTSTGLGSPEDYISSRGEEVTSAAETHKRK